MKIVKLSFGILMLALFTSCAKDGPVGPAGTNGTNGTNGAANITTGLITVPSASWNSSSTNYWNFGVSDNAVVDMTSDVVLAYVLSNGNYFALPCASLLVQGDNMSFAYQNNLVSLIYNNVNPPANTLDFKIVVIPPAIMKAHPGLDLKNYKQVQQALSGM
jgi:hypothetical protein